MLTDRQVVILELLTASITGKQFNPAYGAEIPELTKDAITKLGTVADIFLEVTNEIPHNAENDLEPFKDLGLFDFY
ncbi:MAG: hypothetical protein I4E98_08535 [Planktothrix agardhii KL2]|jgi:hypothetical protein|uniref:hypothetical protein n=1 Tax=Planktothrix agardhii TaxID=1160 RepID=UPI001A216424|nr:hypothetical protein [Planktothrix agardhii]MBG0746626.1 hypothetical protein [Planktothrix agardhii KL2]